MSIDVSYDSMYIFEQTIPQSTLLSHLSPSTVASPHGCYAFIFLFVAAIIVFMVVLLMLSEYSDILLQLFFVFY